MNVFLLFADIEEFSLLVCQHGLWNFALFGFKFVELCCIEVSPLYPCRVRQNTFYITQLGHEKTAVQNLRIINKTPIRKKCQFCEILLLTCLDKVKIWLHAITRDTDIILGILIVYLIFMVLLV